MNYSMLSNTSKSLIGCSIVVSFAAYLTSSSINAVLLLVFSVLSMMWLLLNYKKSPLVYASPLVVSIIFAFLSLLSNVLANN